MRACLGGHEETALALYRWHAPSLKMRNYDGESCLGLAAPHERLCAELARLEKIRKLSQASRSAAARDRGRARSGGSGSAVAGKGGGEFLKPGIISRLNDRVYKRVNIVELILVFAFLLGNPAGLLAWMRIYPPEAASEAASNIPACPFLTPRQLSPLPTLPYAAPPLPRAPWRLPPPSPPSTCPLRLSRRRRLQAAAEANCGPPLPLLSPEPSAPPLPRCNNP